MSGEKADSAVFTPENNTGLENPRGCAMRATENKQAEFQELHSRFRKASERMLILQASAAEGMRKIGEGCTTEEAKAEFAALKKDIEQILARMKEICESLSK